VAVFRNSISADSNNLGKPVSTKTLTTSIDGKKTSFTLLKYKNENTDGFDFILSKKNMIGGSTSLKLTGFENDLNLCEEGNIKLADNSGYAVCLIGDAGVHSQNILLVKYFGGKLSNIKISGGETSGDNISSDVPNYNFVDRNDDGFLDLAVDLRNYDGDPIMESVRSYYKNSGSEFNFDGKENITYNKN
jgi:hypothetical protein